MIERISNSNYKYLNITINIKALSTILKYCAEALQNV